MQRHAPGALAAVLALGWVFAANAQSPPPELPKPFRGRPVHSTTVHDPSTIVKHDECYWVFCTGHGVASVYSRDLITWSSGPRVFAEPPAWVAEVVPGNRGHFWAPDIIHHRGRYLLYYSVSTFGKNTSAIALASNITLDPQSSNYRWTDHGVVIRSAVGDRRSIHRPWTCRDLSRGGPVSDELPLLRCAAQRPGRLAIRALEWDDQGWPRVSGAPITLTD